MEKKIELSYLRRLLAGASQLRLWIWLAFAGYGCILLFALHDYIGWKSMNVLLGLLTLPFVGRITARNGNHYRYGILAVVAALLSCFAPANTLLYFAIVFAVLFVVEAGIGKINSLPLLVAVLMSPMVKYAADVFSFPIRLQLTKLVGSGMQLSGFDVVVRGNMIFYNGNEFAVDPACMGLNMLVTSLITGIMVMAVSQKQYNKVLSNRWMIPVLLVMLMLNLLSNVVRMVALVVLNILPGNIAHDWIGIICLLVYVMLPAIWICRWLIRRYGHDIAATSPQVSVRLTSPKMLLLQLLLLMAVSLAAVTVKKEKAGYAEDKSPAPAVAGFQTERVDAGIIKLQNQSSLVYIKHIPGFYSGDHHPMICWRGSGYAFRQIEMKTIAGTQVYTAILDNNVNQLYTAWWYDNGVHQTINQLSWRWDNLKGSHDYSLLNVTAASTSDMMAAVTNILIQKPFNHILGGM